MPSPLSRAELELTIIGCGPPQGESNVTATTLRCKGGEDGGVNDGQALIVGRAGASGEDILAATANGDSAGIWKSVTLVGLSISGCGGMGWRSSRASQRSIYTLGAQVLQLRQLVFPSPQRLLRGLLVMQTDLSPKGGCITLLNSTSSVPVVYAALLTQPMDRALVLCTDQLAPKRRYT